MEYKDCKPWERPWSTDEISKNSENWNLAGDAGLLRHLQQFSQVLLERTHSSEVALNLLLDGMKATAVDISNVTNTFLMLTNTQFVENRVYEDDDDDERGNISEVIHQVKSKEEQAAENVVFVKKAITLGTSVLDTMFDTVEVPASDSEDDENSESIGRILLQPRNSYSLQPLPCMIGSKEFISDDTVGLMELLSDNDENLNMLPSSSSDTSSDVEHEVTEADGSMHPHSFISTESENSEPENEQNVPFVKNDFFESARKFIETNEDYSSDGAMFGGESPPEVESVSRFAKPTAPIDFASELAAKLGGIPGEKTNFAENDQKQSQDNFFGDGGDLESSLFGCGGKEIREGGLFDDFNQTEKPEDKLWNSSTSKHSNSNAVTTAQETTSSTHSSHILPKSSVPEKETKKLFGGIPVLGMVNNSAAKISPYVSSLPSSSSESDKNEDMKPHTVVPSIVSISKEISDEISNLARANERKTSFIDEQLNNQTFSSCSLFDPDEEDALFLPSSTPKHQNTQLGTSQQRVAFSNDQLDTSGNTIGAASKPTISVGSPKHSSSTKFSSAHGIECSDSDDDKNLFSSTCGSVTSRSSKLHLGFDIFAKTNSTAQKYWHQKSSVFGSDYSEPTFDIFGSSNPIKNNYSNKVSRPVDINKASDDIVNTSSNLFGFDKDDNEDNSILDTSANKSNIEIAKSKDQIFSSEISQVDDFDDIFSSVKTSSKENLFLFSTQHLDDDFDIFSSLAKSNTNNLDRNNLEDSPKSADVSDIKPLEENPLEKPEPPKSLDIPKTNVISSDVSNNNVQEKLENVLFGRKESTKTIPKSVSQPSFTTDAHISNSPPESGPLTTAKHVHSLTEKDFVTDEKRHGIEKTSNNLSGTSSFEASPHRSYISDVLQTKTYLSAKHTSSEKSVGFDSPACTSSVLQSIVKERARIPATRRPQSRKARIEALKSSSIYYAEADAIDTASVRSEKVFEEAENVFSEKIFPGEVQDKYSEYFPGLNFLNSSFTESHVKYTEGDNAENQIVEKNILSVHYDDAKPFSPSTDEEDFFGVPTDLPSEYNSKHTSDFINDVLFGGATILSPDLKGRESHPESLHGELPPFLMPSPSFLNKLSSTEGIFPRINNVKTNTTQGLNNDDSFVPKNVSHETCSEATNFFTNLSPQINEPVERGDIGNTSCQSSRDEFFVSVDNTFLAGKEPDIFHTVPPQHKDIGKTNTESVSRKEDIFTYDNSETVINETNGADSKINSKMDVMHNQQHRLGTHMDSDLISSGIGKTPKECELFEKNEEEIDLFASDMKEASSSQLLDDLFFVPKDQMFSVAANKMLTEHNEIHDGILEDKEHCSSAKEESNAVTILEAKNKKKRTIFLDDDDDDDISIFSSSHSAVIEASQASASPSRKAGSKPYGRVEENPARYKPLSQISKGDDGNFEDPLKVLNN